MPLPIKDGEKALRGGAKSEDQPFRSLNLLNALDVRAEREYCKQDVGISADKCALA